MAEYSHFEITVEYAHSSAAAAFGIIRRAAYTTVSVSGRPSNAQADVLIRVAVVIGNSHFVGIAHQSIAIVIPQTASENITLACHHSDKAHKVPLEAATSFSPYASLVVGGKRLS